MSLKRLKTIISWCKDILTRSVVMTLRITMTETSVPNNTSVDCRNSIGVKDVLCKRQCKHSLLISISMFRCTFYRILRRPLSLFPLQSQAVKVAKTSEKTN